MEINNFSALMIIILGMFFVKFIWVVTDTVSFKERLNFFFNRDKTRLSIIFEALVILNLVSYYFYRPFNNLSAFRIIGLVVFSLGVGLSVWAKLVMKKNWGSPAQHDFKKQKKLVTSPPFSLSRNPIYLGLLFVVVGTGITFFNYFVILSSLIFFLKLRIIISNEEKILVKYFGKVYKDYLRDTPRWL
jgi:protein-S-isoprenylcysteine O-methyltransferase Ste14